MHERWGNEMEEDLWRLSHSLIHTHTRTGFNSYICVIYLYKFIHVHHNFFSKVIFLLLFRCCVCGFFLLLLSFSTLHIRVAVVVLLVLVVERDP